MNIFLTGAVQVGKSTAIDGFLKLCGMTPCGFRTFFGADRSRGDRLLYLCPASTKPSLTPDRAVVRFTGGKPAVIGGAFDALGVPALEQDGQIVIMDELGRFEKDELLFRRAIEARLDGDLPVLGVMRTGIHIPWLTELQSLHDIVTLEVTEQNRDEIPYILMKMFNFSERVE